MKKVSYYLFALLTSLALGQSEVYAQAATYPFPTAASYTSGSFLSSKISSANVQSAYNNWATGAASGLPTGSPSSGPGYLKNCGGGKYSVSNGSGVFSEGIGYGLLLTAYMGDKTAFDGLWAFYKASMDANGLMNWSGGSSCTAVTSGNGATDGDEDAAMALIIASQQWPLATSPYTYKTEATTLIANIKAHETSTGCSSPSTVLYPGDAAGFGSCNCLNASYFAPAYYRVFACFMNDPFWNTLADDVYITLNNAIKSANSNTTTGLVPAWQTNAGAPGGTTCNGTATYQYDACRTPWRIGLDYLWFGTPAAKTYLTTVSTWVKGVGINNIGDGYNLNGGQISAYRNSAFIGPFCVSGMALSQTDVDNFSDFWINESPVPGTNKIDDAPYFQNTLRPLVMLLADGTMWKPSSCGTCLQPSLGSDLSTCSGLTLPTSLNSNTGTSTPSGVTFTWYKNGTAISGQTSYNCPSCATVAGTYVVKRDSTGGCSKSDTIVVSNTISAPTLTGPLNLCSPSTYNLTPSNLASFPGGTTWQWSVDYTGGTSFNNLTGETNSTLLNVRRAGNYRVTATDGSCTNTGSVIVTSSIPTPVDGCIGSGPGTVPLSITNNVGTNYNWYDAATGGSLISGGTGVTSVTSPSISSTKTYYVQDMSVTTGSGSVGPTARLSSGGYTSKGGATQHLTFTTSVPNVLINNIDVYVITYATTNLDFTVTIYKSDHTTQVSTVNSTTITNVPANGAYGLFTLTLPGGLSIPTAGTYDLEVVMSTGSNGNMFYSQAVSPPWSSYTSTGINITGNYSTSSDYSFAYNWQYTYATGTVCDRIPVIAKVGGCTAAPVELVSFTAEKYENRTILNWLTASEINNDHFDIERSLDGINYEVIGKVKGMGNSIGASVYSFADENPPVGKAYYRLVQYDFNGKSTNSFVVVVENDATLSVKVAPNPFNNATDVFVSCTSHDKASIKITDLSGRPVYEGVINNNEKTTLGESLAVGVYLLQIQANNSVKIIKIVKQ